MRNGEGTSVASPEVASPDPLDGLTMLSWKLKKSDGDDESPVDSDYSSCGDSEFERYCSANSAMGTPSLCSSMGTFQDCGDSEFGSVRSFGVGDGGGLENFSLGVGFGRKFGERKLSPSSGLGGLSDQRIESWVGKSSSERLVGRNDLLNSLSKVGSESDLPEVVDLNTVLDEGIYIEDDGGAIVQWRNNSESAELQSSSGTAPAQQSTNMKAIEENIFSLGVNSDTHFSARVEVAIEQVNSGLEELYSHSDVEFDRREGGRCSDEDRGTSCEHSEGEDSMFGYGTDDEQKMALSHQGNMQFHQRGKVEKENSLFMNSSVAFGADDWDDFMQEKGESDLTSVMLEKRQPIIETESNLLSPPAPQTETGFSGVGTDDEQKMDLLNQRNVQYHQETNFDKEKSSVAFGLDDWDDFVQEMQESDLTTMMLEKRQLNIETESNLPSSPQTETGLPCVGQESGEVVKVNSASSNQVQDADELARCIKNGSLTPVDSLDFCETERGKDPKDILVSNNKVTDLDESAEYLQSCYGSDILQRKQDIISQDAPLENGLNFMGGSVRKDSPLLSNQEFDNVDSSRVSEYQKSEKLTLDWDPLYDVAASQICSLSTETFEDQMVGFLREPCSLPPMDENNRKRPLKDSPASFNLFEDHPKAVKIQNLEINEFYNEVVHEMEEILLDSTESPGARFSHVDTAKQSQLPLPLRDGGSTASTSGNDDANSLVQRPLTIDGVEVVGAKQKKGDVSFGERLVGVKEYTVYVIRVWSGKDHWDVERRYRDFCTLYRRLKTLFDSQGWTLPSPWSSVDRESRKVFGNVSPDVVAERSALIQECLQSILHSKFPSSLPSALVWFLSPPKDLPSSPASARRNTPSHFSTSTDTENLWTLGKTISLIVEIQPYKSIKQILEAQHYICAGCHQHFDEGITRMLEFVQILGWGKPRLCEYTGQLFCSSCHTNETAVLPARVLHHWDFTHYPVSQLAKSFLDSIHDQPMLCVSAVNPFLFSKVPALLQVTGVRKKIGAMLPYVRCPFRMSIFKGLASRRYLLESTDFFALRDLIDLSKGAFAALPVMVDTVSRKILEHITEQCLVCCDVGIPCNARQACHDPSSLIFPFQEGEIERCRSCKSVFHKLCFKKIWSCPCGEPFKTDDSTNLSQRVDSEPSGTLDFFGRKSDSKSAVGFLSGLFTKARQEKLWGSKDSDTVILMGSLPSTSL